MLAGQSPGRKVGDEWTVLLRLSRPHVCAVPSGRRIALANGADVAIVMDGASASSLGQVKQRFGLRIRNEHTGPCLPVICGGGVRRNRCKRHGINSVVVGVGATGSRCPIATGVAVAGRNVLRVGNRVGIRVGRRVGHGAVV